MGVSRFAADACSTGGPYLYGLSAGETLLAESMDTGVMTPEMAPENAENPSVE